MERVVGIGGVFFRSKDPLALSHWYRDHLGIDAIDAEEVWHQDHGPTIFSPVDVDATYYFAGPQQPVMVNFRVCDLDAMVAQLKASGAAVDGQIEVEQGAGRFAWVTDPDGNQVQLWEPETPA